MRTDLRLFHANVLQRFLLEVLSYRTLDTIGPALLSETSFRINFDKILSSVQSFLNEHGRQTFPIIPMMVSFQTFHCRKR